MSQLTTTITDPAECSAAVGGSYQHAYVTIVDVKANVNSGASSSDSGWVDLTPGIKPTQIDLLGSDASGGCFLAKLGDNLEVQAGKYQQIRLILGSNSSTMVNGTNYCNQDGGLNAVNCVEDSKNAWHALTTPSAQQTGVKIIPSQLSGGSLDLAAGKTEDLVINFQTCESILQAGNSGQYILQPVLNAGQVSTNSNTINGTVVDASTSKPLPAGFHVLVSLEQPDTNGVDRIVESEPITSSDGTFSFCSVLQGSSLTGTFDVVVSAYNPTTGVAYNTAVVTGVQLGDTTGTIPLTSGGFGAATLNGLVTTTSGSSTAIAEGVNVTPLEANPVSGASTTYFTVPLLQDPPTMDKAFLPTLTTSTTYQDLTTPTTSDNCPSGTACASYFLMVPQSGISVYKYSTSGPTPAASTYSATDASYVVDGIVVPPVGTPPSGLTAGTGTCSPSEEPSPLSSATATAITPTASAQTVTVNPVATPLAFSGCS